MSATTTDMFLTDDTQTFSANQIAANSTPTRSSKPGVSTSTLFQFYGIPIVGIIGIICNLLAFVVFVGTKLRATTCGTYLMTLAVADILFIVGELYSWTDRLDNSYSWLIETDVLCKVAYHMKYSSHLLSALLVTTVTSERFLVVSFPFQANRFQSVVVARVVVAVEVLVAVVFGSYGSILFEVVSLGRSGWCTSSFATYAIYQKCNLVINKVVGEVVTGSLVMILTVLIIAQLAVAKRQRAMMQFSSGAQPSGKSHVDTQLTVMLVTVAAAFVTLRTPFTVCWYLSHYTQGYARRNDTLTQATRISQVLFLSNFAINFFLYSVTGSKFRRCMSELFCCRSAAKYRYNSEHTTHTNLGPSPQPDTLTASSVLELPGDTLNSEEACSHL